jgi:hypothetical protein
VTGAAKDSIPEMVVSPITSTVVILPDLTDAFKIDGDAAGQPGEAAEPEPGLYLQYCNSPGHSIGGMWTVLAVTG